MSIPSISQQNIEFDQWNQLKKELNQLNRPIYFKQREIWWASLGKNLGHEQDGKNTLFERLVLIIRKFNLRIFLAVPLTSSIKKNDYYQPYILQKKHFSAILSQVRLLDSKCLQRKIATLDRHQFDLILNKIIYLIQP